MTSMMTSIWYCLGVFFGCRRTWGLAPPSSWTTSEHVGTCCNMLEHVVPLRSKCVVECCRYRELFHCLERLPSFCDSLRFAVQGASWCKLSWGLTGSAWGDWANYADSPLRASTQDVLFKGGAGSVDGGMGAGSFGGSKSTSTSSSSATVSSTDLGVQAPIGYWDPLGLNANADAATFRRRRAVEIKHGRVAMFATMGYIVPEYYKFPGAINFFNFWRTTCQPHIMISYDMISHDIILSKYDVFWHRSWLTDMTLHPVSPCLTWRISEVMQYSGCMFWDVVRHCEMLCDVLRCCVVFWDVV